MIARNVDANTSNMHTFGDSLFKSHGVLWRTVISIRGNEFISETPLCPNETCHTVLQVLGEGYLCEKCEKTYPRTIEHARVVQRVRDSWEGYQTLRQPVYSLDLPPTKVVDGAEDQNYWVQARISEKSGKRMAVVYFGERVSGKQEKSDYTQVFLDFEDEQLRFDKTNKNPMKLMAKLTAEFQVSSTEIKQRKKV